MRLQFAGATSTRAFYAPPGRSHSPARQISKAATKSRRTARTRARSSEQTTSRAKSQTTSGHNTLSTRVHSLTPGADSHSNRGQRTRQARATMTMVTSSRARAVHQERSTTINGGVAVVPLVRSCLLGDDSSDGEEIFCLTRIFHRCRHEIRPYCTRNEFSTAWRTIRCDF